MPSLDVPIVCTFLQDFNVPRHLRLQPLSVLYKCTPTFPRRHLSTNLPFFSGSLGESRRGRVPYRSVGLTDRLSVRGIIVDVIACAKVNFHLSECNTFLYGFYSLQSTFMQDKVIGETNILTIKEPPGVLCKSRIDWHNIILHTC